MFKYLFYRSYRFQQKIGHKDDPAFFAALFIALSVIIYSVDIFMIVDILFGINFPFLGNAFISGGIGVTIVLFFYFYFVYKDRYLKVIEKYKTEDRLKYIKGTFFALFYFLFALVLFVLSIYLSILQNRGEL